MNDIWLKCTYETKDTSVKHQCSIFATAMWLSSSILILLYTLHCAQTKQVRDIIQQFMYSCIIPNIPILISSWISLLQAADTNYRSCQPSADAPKSDEDLEKELVKLVQCFGANVKLLFKRGNRLTNTRKLDQVEWQTQQAYVELIEPPKKSVGLRGFFRSSPSTSKTLDTHTISINVLSIAEPMVSEQMCYVSLWYFWRH